MIIVHCPFIDLPVLVLCEIVGTIDGYLHAHTLKVAWYTPAQPQVVYTNN